MLEVWLSTVKYIIVIFKPLTNFSSHACKFIQEMLCSTKAACRIRVFDLILNLGVHAQLLEPMVSDNVTTIEEEYAQETYIDNENRLLLQGTRKKDLPKMSSTSSAIVNFESWILKILFEILLLLVQVSTLFLLLCLTSKLDLFGIYTFKIVFVGWGKGRMRLGLCSQLLTLFYLW